VILAGFGQQRTFAAQQFSVFFAAGREVVRDDGPGDEVPANDVPELV
jgi:hypothetical protein